MKAVIAKLHRSSTMWSSRGAGMGMVRPGVMIVIGAWTMGVTVIFRGCGW